MWYHILMRSSWSMPYGTITPICVYGTIMLCDAIMQARLSREEKGRLIAETPNQIMEEGERFYKVASQSRDTMYDVVKKLNGAWLCTCPDKTYRQIERCKHIIACQIREQLKQKVRENIVIQPVEITTCVFCHSGNLQKFGLRRNKYGDIQRFLCAGCKRTFSVNLGFERMKHNAQAITTAMQLYFSGESLRNTARIAQASWGSCLSQNSIQLDSEIHGIDGEVPRQDNSTS